MTRRPAIAGPDRRWPLAWLIAAALGQGAMLVAAAIAVRDAVSVIRSGDTAMPVGSLVLLAAAGLGLAGLRYLERVLAERVGQRYVAEARAALFQRLSTAPASWLARRRSGALSLRYVSDLTALKNWVGIGLARAISAAVMLPVALLVLLAIDLRVGLVAALPVGLALLLMRMLGGPLHQTHSALRRHRARLAAEMAERLQQATALRRAGRLRTEKRLLRSHSDTVIAAAEQRARVSAAIRVLPDAASGLASASALAVCLLYRIPIGETVAALLTLSMIVRPMRHIADVRDRHAGWLIASEKLEQALAAPRIRRLGRPLQDAVEDEPALDSTGLMDEAGESTLVLDTGEVRLLSFADSALASRLLLLAAGMDQPSSGTLRVFGREPAEIDPQTILYLGAASPALRGSLRRDLLLGTGQSPDDAAILAVLDRIGLRSLAERLGGLDGRVEEQRRNLSSDEIRGILLARGLIAEPGLALVDAVELGLRTAEIAMLAAHFEHVGCAALIAISPEQADALAPDSTAGNRTAAVIRTPSAPVGIPKLAR